MYIWDVPIEPLEERYSKQWAQWFRDEFDNADCSVIQVSGETLTDTIETGSFLDCFSTHYWKFTQLKKMIQQLRNGTQPNVIFFHDLWFPGIEALAYIRDMTGKGFKIAGYLHAGSYDRHDLLAQKNMGRWAQFIERGWLQFIDHIFVGSQHHKDMILEARDVININLAKKIHPIGYPIDVVTYGYEPRQFNRDNIIVFPHRLNKEKNPDMFDKLKMVLEQFPILKGYEFIKTKDVCSNKDKYYELLRRAKIAISFADQETFGIAMVEAAALGCIPITPDRLSYQDTMEWQWRFGNFDECCELVIKAITSNIDYYQYPKIEQYKPSKIVEQILYVLAKQTPDDFSVTPFKITLH